MKEITRQKIDVVTALLKDKPHATNADAHRVLKVHGYFPLHSSTIADIRRQLKIAKPKQLSLSFKTEKNKATGKADGKGDVVELDFKGKSPREIEEEVLRKNHQYFYGTDDIKFVMSKESFGVIREFVRNARWIAEEVKQLNDDAKVFLNPTPPLSQKLDEKLDGPLPNEEEDDIEDPCASCNETDCESHPDYVPDEEEDFWDDDDGDCY